MSRPTSARRSGAVRAFNAAPFIPAAVAHCAAMAPTNGQALKASVWRAGTAQRGAAPSVCSRIFSASGCRGCSARLRPQFARQRCNWSIEAAADALRQDDVSLPSAVRWLRRRMRALAAQRVWRSQQDMGADQARVGDEVDPPTRDAIRCKAHHKDLPIQEICRPLSRSSTSGGGTWLFKTAAPEHICTG